MSYGTLEKDENDQSKEDDDLDFVCLVIKGSRSSPFLSGQFFASRCFHWIRIKWSSPIRKAV